MKKTLVFVLTLTLILMISFASASYAAVTVGGNLRVWYQATNDANDAADSSSDTFRFELLALTLASELSGVNGFKGEIQFRGLRSANENDLRIDNAYYYQKGIFFKSDELDIGYIQQLPFKGAYNAVLLGSLANSVIKDTNSLGLKYAGKASQQFDFALALLSSKNQYSKDDTTYEGFDYGLRLNYTPISPLKIGLAYVNDAVNNANYKTAYVVDATYNAGPFGAYLEYLSGSKVAAGATTVLDPAIYLELSYKAADPVTIYAGVTTGLGTAATSANQTFSYSFVDADNNFKPLSNWAVLGCKYGLAAKTTLQAEYIAVSGDLSQSAAAVRLLVNF